MIEYLKTFQSDEFPGKFLVQLQLENLSNEEASISPISVRQVRQCDVCIYQACFLGGGDCLSTYCHKREELNQEYGDMARPNGDKCEHNYTFKEIEELIDEHNAKEATQ